MVMAVDKMKMIERDGYKFSDDHDIDGSGYGSGYGYGDGCGKVSRSSICVDIDSNITGINSISAWG